MTPIPRSHPIPVVKTKRYEFDFSISYAGEEEGLARDLERFLTDKGSSVYLAAKRKSELFGRNLRVEFRQKLGENARYFVPIISKNYVEKDWTQFEMSAALKDQPNRNYEYILPLRLDENEQPGLNPAIGFLDIRKEGLVAVADTLIEKLGREGRIGPPEGEVKYLVVTFGVNTSELLKAGSLPPAAPTHYAKLCDWLQSDITTRVQNAGLEDVSDVLEDSRAGETFSVRIALKWNTRHALDFGDLDWWEVLEVAEFDEVYPEEKLTEMLGWDS